jgi:TPR repeat protein
MLLDGYGLPQNRPLATFWFRRAAEQLDPDAMNMLGRCCEEGWGCTKDIKAAADWYHCSARAGDLCGQTNYALVRLRSGAIVEAAQWFAKAAAAGTPEVRRAIACMLARARDPLLRAVCNRALNLLSSAPTD